MFSARETLSTEQSYVEQLKILVRVFKKPLEDADIIDKHCSNAIFSNIESILKFHQTLLHKLERRMKIWKKGDPRTQMLGQIFNKLVSLL